MRRNFWRSADGNVAMLFAICIVPVLAGAGIALDFMRAGKVRADLAESSDGGLLAAARSKLLDPTLTDAAASAIARRYFDSNSLDNSDLEIQTFTFDYDPATRSYSLDVTGRVRSLILGVVGQDWLPINIRSEAKVAPPRVLEAVLVLDNTQSMAGAKIDALKDAATNLVDEIMNGSGENVKVGIVPFSRYVNVGLSRRSEPWLTVPADFTDSGTWCRDEFPDRTTSNCTTSTRSCTYNNDGVVTTGTCTDTHCDVDDGEPARTCTPYSYAHIWRGCVGSRNPPHDVKDIAWTGQPAPGLLDVSCPNEITPLTADKTTVLNAINAMSVEGNTYIPSGLFWGQAVISADEPFTEAKTSAEVAAQSGLKAVILMTDGMNTLSATHPSHNGGDTAAANAKTAEICEELKDNDVQVFTVSFQVSDTTIQNLLDACATDPANSYDADNATELSNAFLEIGRSLAELALTK